jgi:hypothetical protein
MEMDSDSTETADPGDQVAGRNYFLPAGLAAFFAGALVLGAADAFAAGGDL